MTWGQLDRGQAALWLWGSKPTPLKSHTQIMRFTPQNLNSYFPWPHQQNSPWIFLLFCHCIYHPQVVSCLACEWEQSATLVLRDISASGAQFPVKPANLASSLCVCYTYFQSLLNAIALGRYFKDLQILIVVFSSRDCSICPFITVLALPVQLDMLQTAAMNIRWFMHPHKKMILKNW